MLWALVRTSSIVYGKESSEDAEEEDALAVTVRNRDRLKARAEKIFMARFL